MTNLDPTAFLEGLFAALLRDGIDAARFELDHVCYRVATAERYAAMKHALGSEGILLGEHLIGGRPIATYRLDKPYQFRNRTITVLELPSPKPGSAYLEGFEHAEFVVDEDPRSFASHYPSLAWDFTGSDKPKNADVRLNYDGFSVKFHQRSLADVITEEQKS